MANEMGHYVEIEVMDKAIEYFYPFLMCKIKPYEGYFGSFGVLEKIRRNQWRIEGSGAKRIHNFRTPRHYVPEEFARLKNIQGLMEHRQRGGRLSRSRIVEIYDFLESRSNPAFLSACLKPKGILGKQWDQQLIAFKNGISPAK